MPHYKTNYLEYFGRVDERGQVILPHRIWKEVGLQYQGQDILISVRRDQQYRTNQQLRYYFGAIVRGVAKMLKELGHEIDENKKDDIEDLHSFLKEKFLTYQVIALGGDVITKKKTTKMKVEDFFQYCEEIRDWTSTFWGYYIESPEEWEEAQKVILKGKKDFVNLP